MLEAAELTRRGGGAVAQPGIEVADSLEIARKIRAGRRRAIEECNGAFRKPGRQAAFAQPSDGIRMEPRGPVARRLAVLPRQEQRQSNEEDGQARGQA